jgi:hypothetical protein
VRALQAIVAVPELFLTWADVSPELLEANLADGRKHRRVKKRRRRLARARSRARHSAFVT